ncbi:MAG: SMP-30/gluconolactonase/LRE family protein [Thiohalomonadales bacterium]
MLRTLSLMLLTSIFLLGSLVSVASEKNYPEIIPVPNGFHPEGIALGSRHKAFVGSLLNGAIYQVDLLTAEGEILVNGEEGRVAVGLAYDVRRNQLFVAGGLNGSITVYDAEDGELITEFQAGPNFSGFINDGIITKRAAYFTDSFLPVIYKIALSKTGKLMHTSGMERIPLTGDLVVTPGDFNANGIVASEDGETLLINTTTSGQLFSVNPRSGYTTEIMISGGDLINGDGLVLHDDYLYVVQNFTNQIAVVELSEDHRLGTIINILSHPEFRVPTTAVKFGHALYAINARFDIAPPPFFSDNPSDPNTTFNIIKVELPRN